MRPASTSSRRPAPDARELAVALLTDWIEEDRLPERDSRARGRAFVQEVALGVARNRSLLDQWIERAASREPEPAIRAILWMSLYELLFLTDSPPHAVVHSAVNIARANAGVGASGFVNAVLRRAQRDGGKWKAEAERSAPWVRWSHPEALGRKWWARYGAEATAALCRWDNEPAEAVARVCAGRVAFEDVRRQWAEAGVDARPHPAAPDRYLILPRGAAPPSLPGFAEGHFYLQDPSTEHAPALLDPQPGERVLDACAAPGGKTIWMAERMQRRGVLAALEPSNPRRQMLQENLHRMRQEWVAIQGLDARACPPSRDWTDWDAILLDAPCSNTGVLRRRPAARWRFNAEALAASRALQRELLDALAPRLRPGGRIVYSTCSLEAEENEEQVRSFLQRHADFALDGEVRCLPQTDGCDGAYAARLKRV
ncbi:MAG: 16S rRNA (cytosine(967)-C(5))-methyltransferase RsmB [Kiritimatiellae bacterium]|nr:16S rRNA (cytosine(967)-C(5))-methyltransferase RsmB [Kiritimatiellia bacterium]